MTSSTLREDGEKLFHEHREVIAQVVESIIRRERLDHHEAEEFRSYVNMRLVESDYALLLKFKGKSSIGTYLATSLGRWLLDHRIHVWGKYHASAEAKRLGEIAVVLETFLHRDGRTPEDALSACRSLDPEVTLPRLEELAARLPPRRRKTRFVDLDAVGPRELSVSPDTVVAGTTKLDADRDALSRKMGAILRVAMAAFPPETRLLLQLVFASGMTIAQAARVMNKDQKPLYRTFKRCIATLRGRLEESGISGGDTEEILSGKFAWLDFGLRDKPEETDSSCPSLSDDQLADDEED